MEGGYDCSSSRLVTLLYQCQICYLQFYCQEHISSHFNASLKFNTFRNVHNKILHLIKNKYYLFFITFPTTFHYFTVVRVALAHLLEYLLDTN